jgi:hypothetical protein
VEGVMWFSGVWLLEISIALVVLLILAWWGKDD